MKRPALVTVVNVVQVLLGLLLAGTTAYLVVLTRSKEILAEPESADTVHGLLIGALVLGIPAMITLIGAVGLWKGRFWGWVLSLATDVGVVAVFVYSMIDDNAVDTEMLVMAAGFVVPLVLLLIPAVRSFFWNSTRGLQVR